MSHLSRQEIANRAGIPLEEVGTLVELGILSPTTGDRFRSGDVRRIGVVKMLQEAGMPLDGLATLLKSRDVSLNFLDSPMYGRLAALSSTTFSELSAKTGIPVDLLMVVREAMGSAAPQPDDLVREDELEVIPFLEVNGLEGMNPHVTERLLRVMGDSLRRVAEQQADWWQSEVIMPLIRGGAKAGETGDLSQDFGEEINPKYQRAFLAIQRAQEARTWTANVLTGIEMAMTSAGLYSRQDRPPAMCFLDITGYTRLTQERGDEAAAALASTFSRMVQRTSAQYAGRAVKWLGDGVMFYFADPGPGVVAALDMVDGAVEAGLPQVEAGMIGREGPRREG